MKKYIFFLTFAICVMSSNYIFSQTRNVEDFHAVNAATSVSVTLVKSNSPHVEFEMTKGVAKNLVTEVKNGVLYIKVTPNNTKSYIVTSANVTVYYDHIDKIHVRAGSTLKSGNTIEAEDFDLEVTSGSSANLDIETNKMKLEVNSGASLILEGKTEKGYFDITSGSTFNGSKFITEDAVVDASSGASAILHVDHSLEAEASSGASVSYTGNVKELNIDTGWSSSIKRRH